MSEPTTDPVIEAEEIEGRPEAPRREAMAAAMALVRMDPQALMARALEMGNLEALEKLIDMAERVQTISARQAYREAMAEFQRLCPPIRRNRTARIESDKGSYTFHYASLGHIRRLITPFMAPLGLSYSFESGDETAKPGHVRRRCRISHSAGHSETGAWMEIPIQEGRGGANSAQRVGIARTYACRYALEDATGITAEDDTDGAVPGEGASARPVDTATGEVLEPVISANQVTRFWAIARGPSLKWSDPEVHALLVHLALEPSVAKIPKARYEEVIEEWIRKPEKLLLKLRGAEPAAKETP